jgi:hypothetical protein
LLLLPVGWLLLVLFAIPRRFKTIQPVPAAVDHCGVAGVGPGPAGVPAAVTTEPEPDDQLVILVDQSASLGPAGRQALRVRRSAWRNRRRMRAFCFLLTSRCE